ncbi:MAG: 2-isopropylmalate synthase [Clostridiales bacterium]|jgi:2-isopropylmalate synthase|nr:2-isopropylmalate synthase [Clostridiales bacterium]
MDHTKYRAFKPLDLPDRQWPFRTITAAPIWCSVDLRDGNQALEVPMALEQKLEFYQYLLRTGFKEIEVGFPAASNTEFQFTRALIERDLIPGDVVIQVLTQSREHLIRRTFESLAGARKAIVHLYNSTSALQREVVFGKSREEIKELAAFGARLFNEFAEQYGREKFIFEYSPESFTGTEMDYAMEVCNEVLRIWKPDAAHKVIINLPSTVEMATPNVYADQVEYMCRHLEQRENVIVSLHAHNDRGTAVAATELALMAGAERVEGTLFGNGERTGNADILTIAMNLYSQGVDIKLDFSELDELMEMYEKSTGMNVHPRHPYAGALVYTAFSGSHQDAINKGLNRLKSHPDRWEVPYLPIDPMDVGRSYDPIIRINSQSGKGGVAYILERHYGLQIPKKMRQHFGEVVTGVSDAQSKELLPDELYTLFRKEYVNIEKPLQLLSYTELPDDETMVEAKILLNGSERVIRGVGNGFISAFCNAVMPETLEFEIKYYSEHSLEYGSKSRAITYMEISVDGTLVYGAGISSSISTSSLRAIVSAVNKALAAKEARGCEK